MGRCEMDSSGSIKGPVVDHVNTVMNLRFYIKREIS
jgi:hypothetical protein